MSRPKAALRLLVLFLSVFAGAAEAGVRRVAVVVGNNAGTGARPTLRYAEDDARRVARALREVGEVRAQDILLVTGRGQAAVEDALEKAGRLLRHSGGVPGTQTMLTFYFSGHGDGEALELGSERLSYAHLKALLAGTGADTRVAIIDACQSGAAILKKGGKPAPTFALQLADRLALSGEVFITSTTAQQSALESSELKGSFFTHHLLSGLRGAADSTADAQVSLTELYRYAYERTVSTTALTPAGVQHPSYQMALSGQGELVMSSLASAAARLDVPEGPERVVIEDASGKEVLAEVLPGAARTIALAPGRYSVRTVEGGRTRVASVLLTHGTRHALSFRTAGQTSPAQLSTKGEQTQARASVAPSVARAAPPAPVRAAPTVAGASRPIDGKLRICILPFKNLTSDPKLDYLGDALAEAVATDFGLQKDVRLIERGQVELGIGELEFSSGKYVNPATRAALGRIQGAEVVVLGSYQRAGERTRVSGRFVHVETGEILHTLKVEKPAAAVLPLQDEVAARVRDGVPGLRQRLRPR